MVSAEVAALTQQHKKLTWQRISIVAGLCLIAAVAFVVSNFVGAIDISPGEVIRGIVNPSSLDDQTHTVLWKRWPSWPCSSASASRWPVRRCRPF